MAEPENLLANAEVWDDSALIDSWNEALAEYKKYHSIHAKRGNLKELQQHKRPSAGPVNGNLHSAAEQEAVDNAQSAAAHSQQRPPPPTQGLPQAFIGSIRDENLKKLLMSWYYAGYYTGLYEGQQQAQEEKAPSS